MSAAAPRVVFDCVVFAQALINPDGPAAKCVRAAQAGAIRLFVSQYVLEEILELPAKIKPQLGVTADRVRRLVSALAGYSTFIADVPMTYTHPLDVDDSPYINLALAAAADLIVSRDRHMLALVDAANAHDSAFMARFPQLRIIAPEALLSTIQQAQ